MIVLYLKIWFRIYLIRLLTVLVPITPDRLLGGTQVIIDKAMNDLVELQRLSRKHNIK